MVTLTRTTNYDLSQTQLPTNLLTLVRFGFSSALLAGFLLNLTNVNPTAVVLNQKRTPMTTTTGVLYDWIDLEIYIPLKYSWENHLSDLLGCLPTTVGPDVSKSLIYEQLTFLPGTEDPVYTNYIETANDTAELVAYLTTVPFTFTGVMSTTDTANPLVLRVYPADDFGTTVLFDRDLTLELMSSREGTTPLFTAGWHPNGFWIHAQTLSELAVRLGDDELVVADPMQQQLVTHAVSKLHINPVFGIVLNAYKLAYGYLTVGVINSVFTQITEYSQLLEFVLTPIPPSPENIRAFIAEYITTAAGRYGVTIQGLSN